MQMSDAVQDLLGLESVSTPVWGYGTEGVTYPGPTLVAKRDVPLHVQWQNELRGNHLLPVDTSIHLANPSGKFFQEQEEWGTHGIPVVPHLHGGRTESASDGLPEAWWTPGEKETGAFFEKTRFRYDNSQEAATLWYHDHALGITRLNVYAGLAGFYLLRDENEQALIEQNVLPGGDFEVEIVIQDRIFSGDGQLYYPSHLEEFYTEEERSGITFPSDRPSVLPEFFGDVILVNGVAWPKLEVEPRKYRLRLLNGSDSRFYVLEFHRPEGTAVPFLQIGTDNGFLERPAVISRLLLAPGERADVVVDFSSLEGSSVHLRNFGPDEPFKGFDELGKVIGGAADPETTGQVMRFDVDIPHSNAPEATVQPGRTDLRAEPIPQWKHFEKQADRRRGVALFEGTDQYGRLQPLLGVAEPTEDTEDNVVNGSLAWFEPITENPAVGDVEVWEIYNATEDAHPIHLHLVKFLILNREPFEAETEEKVQPEHGDGTGTGGVLRDVVLSGHSERPKPNERGWKDTVVAFPNEVTRVAARFDREGRYVWHCHILSHEDHEMMRSYYVGSMERQLAKRGRQPTTQDQALRPVLHTAQPNPFHQVTTLRFELPRDSHVSLEVFDVTGRRVALLVDGQVHAGVHQVRFDGSQFASGVYLGRLRTLGQTLTERMVLLR